MEFIIVIVVLSRSQFASLEANLSSISGTSSLLTKTKIHLIHYPILPETIKQLVVHDLDVEVIRIPKRTNVEWFLKQYIRQFLENGSDVLLLDPSWQVLHGFWEALSSPDALKSPPSEHMTLYMNGDAGTNYIEILNSLYHKAFAVKISYHSIQDRHEETINPTKGWILPYHTLVLKLMAQGELIISEGNYFAPRLAERKQGSWATWKYMLNIMFMQLNSQYRGEFNNLTKKLQQIHDSPLAARQPMITILMSVYNESRYIETCLQSLAFQSNTNFNMVIIDDASTDDTANLLEKWNSQIPNCMVHRLQENSGKGVAMNNGLSYVTTRYVLELDADDWLDPDAIEVISNRVASLNRNVVYAYGDRRVFAMDESGYHHRFKSIYRGRKLSKRQFLRNKKPYGPRVYLTSALREVGGWPIDKNAGNRGRVFEDFFVVTRLLFVGQFVYWPQNPVYNIRSHRNSQSISHLHELNRWLKPYINRMANKLSARSRKR